MQSEKAERGQYKTRQREPTFEEEAQRDGRTLVIVGLLQVSRGYVIAWMLLVGLME